MRDIGGQSFSNMKVIVSTPSTNANFVVESSSKVIHSGTVNVNSPVVVDIPSEMQVIDSDFENREKGIHVYSTGDQSISLLAETYVNFVNYGVFLVYPCLVFEIDSKYEYGIVSVDDPSNIILSEFLLVGCDNNTNITIIPSQAVKLPVNLQIASSLITIDRDMTSHHIILHQMQTILITSFDDLTGTKIISNKPVTVISGHVCANIPASEAGCEPISVQIPPTFTWGTKFLVAPFTGRASAQVFKAVSSDKNTSFTYKCGSKPTISFSRASVIEFNSDTLCYVTSTKPAFVVQFSIGGSLDSNMGDPAIAIVPPIDQHVPDISFVTLPTNEFPSTFISVTVTADNYAPNSILLDGAILACTWQSINSSSDEIVGYGCSMPVTSGKSTRMQHNVSHIADGLLSVLVYGFSSFPAQGYAYLAGQYLTITDFEGIHII